MKERAEKIETARGSDFERPFDESVPAITDTDINLSTQEPFRICTVRTDGAGKYCDVDWIGGSPCSTSRGRKHITVAGTGTSVASHAHNFYEIALLHSGKERFIAPDANIAVKRGDILFIRPGVAHGYENLQASMRTNIYVEPKWLLDDLSLLWHEPGLIRYLLTDALFEHSLRSGVLYLRCNASETRRWEQEIDDIKAGTENPTWHVMLYNACFLNILAMLNAAFLRLPDYEKLLLSPQAWTITEAIEMLAGQGRGFSPERIAAVAKTPFADAAALFMAETACTPHDFFAERRMHHAMRLLQNPNMRIQDIARHLGYADAAHLSRSFKQYSGMLPREYRGRWLESNRKDDNLGERI